MATSNRSPVVFRSCSFLIVLKQLSLLTWTKDKPLPSGCVQSNPSAVCFIFSTWRDLPAKSSPISKAHVPVPLSPACLFPRS